MNNIENTKFLLKINQTPDVHTFDIEESATSLIGKWYSIRYKHLQ